MKYRSTREPINTVTLSHALSQGLAEDGGLFVPVEIPEIEAEALTALEDASYVEIAKATLSPFFLEDPLHQEIDAICAEAFHFPLELVDLKDHTALMELFHGPSSAFKDFGASLLASCLARIHEGSEQPLTVLVATSGDTGSAVAAAFHRKPGIEVIILYPRDHVSSRQAHQLACWGDNVTTFSVDGDFDACQRMAKEAFADSWWRANVQLTSANSINIGRLLPQMTYYAAASLEYRRRHGVEPGFVVPSGNVGNGLAAVWARKMGFPIREVVFASNANRAVVEWVKTGQLKSFETVHTLANAMDVGAPSNLERLSDLYPEPPDWLGAESVDDARIRETIAAGEERWGQVYCPHTACAVAVREDLSTPHWIVAATAHAAKFETVVEPLIGHPVEVPPVLAELLERSTNRIEIEPRLGALTQHVAAAR